MIKLTGVLSLVLALGWIMGCGKSQHIYDDKKFQVKRLEQSETSFMVPRSLVKAIEGQVSLETTEKSIFQGLDAYKERRFLPLKIYLKSESEKNKGLKAPDLVFNLRFDQAILDLKDYVSNRSRASFRFYPYVEDVEEPGLGPLIVFYLSNAVTRAVDGREFGAGCRAFSNISNPISQAAEEGGLVVNTAKLRYVSVLAGTYVFLRVSDEHFYMSTLAVTDSRHPELLCKP